VTAPEGSRVELTVPALLDGVRVDRAVAMLGDVSRAVAAELVTTGQVRVDGRPVTTRSVTLAAGSTLEVVLPPDRPASPTPDPSVVLDLVHEDDQVLVVDKPAGLVVHPGAGHRDGTLVAGILARYPDVGLLGGSVCPPERPGIVHRLDRGTSGLLAVARTELAYESLVSQLAARTVERRYLALAEGLMADDRGVVEAPIGRSARTPTKMTVSAQGRRARTGYRVVDRDPGPPPTTLVVLTLETGRTHQIRVHLAAIGHPVVGDDRYGAPRGPAGERLFLHAARLGFDHPTTGERLRFTSPLPAELAGRRPDLPEDLGPVLDG
jgi:23S rRNA pseudouridine1911/1915/1917 synthase